MSGKIILSLAAAATIAVASLASQSADARGFGGGFGGGRSFGGGGGFGGGGHVARAAFTGHGGRTLTPIFPGRSGHRIPIVPIHPIDPGHPIGFDPHHHHHWVFRDGGWVVIDDVVDEAPAVVAEPGPCTCLTKAYTPSGLVVFADVCTKESASASVDGSADATQVPTTPVAAMAVPMSVVPTTPNYAGRTYEDYLAANPQAAQPQASTPPAATAPQKN
jgi:hypothetical protein